MIADQRKKVLGLSDLFFKVPSYSRLFLYLVAASFFIGFLVKSFANGFSADSLVFGASDGLFLLGFPALFSAILAASILSRKEFRFSFKYFLLTALVSCVLAGAIYTLGVLSAGFFGLTLETFVLLANVLVFLSWFVSAFLLLNYNVPKAIGVSILHPFFNLSFLFFSAKLGLLESSVSFASPFVALPKLVLSSAVLLVALWAVFFVLNAPAKSNFGVSTVEAIALFSAQWIRGSKGIEKIFSEMGEEVKTYASAVFFRKGKKLKLALLLPLVHYGPFGNVGGSEFPFLLREKFEKQFGSPAVVLHGAVNHDFNPVHSSSVEVFSKAFAKMAGTAKSFGGSDASFLESHLGSKVSAFGISSNDFALVSLSRAPLPTDDLEFSFGLALKNKLHSFREAMVVDRHNSFSEDYSLRPGGNAYYDYEDAVTSLIRSNSGKMHVGFGRSTKSFLKEEGVGDAGVSAIVFQIGGKTACFIVFDANNALASFRKVLLKRFSSKFHFVDLFTTDTHSVNNLSGVHNPLGQNCNVEKLVAAAEEAVSNALADVEIVEVFAQTRQVSVKVLGTNRQNELLSTLNSIVSIARIIAPIVFVVSILLVLFLLVY